MSRPPISIVIRTLNAAETLGAVLAKLDRGATDQWIVVDSGSTDGTLEIAQKYGAEVIPIRKEDFSYGRALNRGFNAARHDWILSLSAHTIPAHADFLESYGQAIGRFPKSVTAAVGPILGEFDAALSGGITLFQGNDLRRGFGFGAGNPNSLYLRSAWQRRPFDEKIGGGEDLQWYFDALKVKPLRRSMRRASTIAIADPCGLSTKRGESTTEPWPDSSNPIAPVCPVSSSVQRSSPSMSPWGEWTGPEPREA